MSVEVKTPTKSQFKIEGFQCGEHLEREGQDHVKSTKPKTCKDVSFQERSDEKQQRHSFSKGEKPKDIQYRKRRYSMPQKLGEGASGSHIAFMKRKKFLSDVKFAAGKITLPTKFLLGGNINDPLNLNSLYHDEEGRVLNESTPVSSPLPMPSHRKKVEVVLPPNITDPLNLEADDDTFMGRICKKRKRSYRHKRKESTTHSTPLIGKEGSGEKKRELLEALKIDIDTSQEVSDENSEQLSLDIQSANANKTSNKIVSPVIPQASPKIRRRRKTISECSVPHDLSFEASRALFTSSSPEQKITPPKKPKRQFSNSKNNSKTKSPLKFASDPKFIYGNYNRYYGYRNPSLEKDHRMVNFDPEWFECKDVLDIGCNVGHLTLSLAQDFHPRKIVGMDIDANLIKMARKNIRHYLTSASRDVNKYPSSNSVNYGPMAAPPLAADQEIPKFPNNLMFIQGNIVLESDDLLEFQQEEYDLILALSITKWIHLNWGDEGLKRTFRRMFKLLRPGGKLILEPQAWASYKKRKKLTEDIYKNYSSIKLKPEHFRNYLLQEVGFTKCEVIGVPYNKSKGFRRPLQLYTKTDTVSSTPFTDVDETSQSSQHRLMPWSKMSSKSSVLKTEVLEHVKTSSADHAPKSQTVQKATEVLQGEERDVKESQTSEIETQVQSQNSEIEATKDSPSPVQEPCSVNAPE